MPIRPNSNPNMDMPNRPMPCMVPPDYRIHQMNRRLQERMEDCDNQWWNAFATEFFDDKATFTLSFFLEDGLKRYTIGRTLIPRFFRTMFDSGVVDMNIVLRHPKDFPSNAGITLDCEQATMVTHHTKPVPTKVCAEGHLCVDFIADELMRIRSWHFAIRSHLEYIPKQAPMQNPGMLEDLCKNTTRQGLTSAMLNYLKMCVIIEPMKELMSRQKACNMDPRDCLKSCLFQKWQRMLNPPTDTARPGTKRPSRKRKNSTTNPANAVQGQKKKVFTTSDVMMVGEPTLMGSEFGEDDERMITRLENQFDTPLPVKSEDHDTSAASFPSVSSPTHTPSQWQQPTTSVPSTIQQQAPHVKSEPGDVSSNSTPPLYTTPPLSTST
uniref:LIM domain-binding protein 2-like n=1 Tax=Phallusia mammillata TaxID=59560 RepID=A0A6F9DIX7_9ASCI|nr:LIM domain-binding protein 2-like [Phallusia mammillata]